MKKTNSIAGNLHCRLIAIILLTSAVSVATLAQSAPSSQPFGTETAAQSQSTQGTQTNLPSETQEPLVPYTATPVKSPQEGFWGHMNPFARKKWVKKQLDPLHDQLNELDEVNAKNAQDIKDVDSRAQAGIFKAQSTADAADQTASVAGAKAQSASSSAQNAMNHVDSLTTTVNSLDNYNQKAEVDVAFRRGQPVLSVDARNRLDDLASKVSGQPGYILEIEAYSPASGAAGIQNSERLAEAVKRYLVTEHQIPVYRMHAVALGNAHVVGSDEGDQPVRTSNVRIRLMENSLAGQESASAQGADSVTGVDEP